MTEIDFKSLKRPLSETVSGNRAQAYLVHGEEMLVEEAFAAVLGVLLPEGKQSLNFEQFDGAEADLLAIVERINTYSLMGGNKVVALTDARLFSSGQERAGRVKKAQAAVLEGDLKGGARHLLAAMAAAGVSFEDLSGENRQKGLKALGIEEEAEWLAPLLDHCREMRLQVPTDRDGEGVLQAALEKGFPSGNHLIVTAGQVDRRRSLYAAFKKRGCVIDCSVPGGERLADRRVQEAVMRRQMDAVLEKAGKQIEPEAAARLFEMLGFDLRAAAGSLEKLIDYAGDRDRIRKEDVQQVLSRTKKDPIFEFTNALTDRDLDGALFYLDSLLVGGVLSHPLQLLGAAANQLRKLIVFKEFSESPEGRLWQPQMNFNTFKSRVLPVLQESDRRLTEKIDVWRRSTVKEKDGAEGSKKKKNAAGGRRKTAAKTDLKMVANPNNAYPVYLLLKKSDRFTLKELEAGLLAIAGADIRIKSGSGDPRLILEKAVITVCSEAG